jgi:hypothetical protein
MEQCDKTSFNVLAVESAMVFFNYGALPRILQRCSNEELRYTYLQHGLNMEAKKYFDDEIKNRFSDDIER